MLGLSPYPREAHQGSTRSLLPLCLALASLLATGALAPDPVVAQGPHVAEDPVRPIRNDPRSLPPGWLVKENPDATYVLSSSWNPPELCFTVSNPNSAAALVQDINIAVTLATILGISGTGPSGESLTTGNGQCYDNGPNSKGCYANGGGPGTTLTVCVTLGGAGSGTSASAEANVNTGGGPSQVATASWSFPAGIDITISKFEDLNGNGVRDGNDPAMANVGFHMDDDLDGVVNGAELTATTGSSGLAVFEAIQRTSGTGRLREMVPINTTSTTGSTVDIDFGTPSSIPDQYRFGNFFLGSVAGQLFADRFLTGTVCPYGQWESGAAGKSGATECEPCPNESSEAEACLFPYPTVTLAPLPGCTTCPPGSFSGVDLVVAGGSLTTHSSVPWGQTILLLPTGSVGLSSTYQHTFVSRDTWSPTIGFYRNGTVGGRVAVDTNADGTGDTGLAGASVSLSFDNVLYGPVVTTTGTDGTWTSDAILPGTSVTYQIALPSGYSNIAGLSGSVLVSSGASFSVETPVLAPFTFTVQKNNDLNGDGVLGASEPGMPDVTFCVDVNADLSCDAGDPGATTDASGRAVISGIPRYSSTLDLIETADPNTTRITFPPTGRHTVDFGQLTSDPPVYSFLNTLYSSISGTLHADRFGTGSGALACPAGTWQSTTGTSCEACPADNAFCLSFGNLPVSLVESPGCTTCAPSWFAQQNLTTAGRSYTFSGVSPGQFVIITPNAGYSVASPVFTLLSGFDLSDRPAFVSTNATLGGRAYLDINRNSVFDAGENLIAGARLVVTDLGISSVVYDALSGADGTWPTFSYPPGRDLRWATTVLWGPQLTERSGQFRTESGGTLMIQGQGFQDASFAVTAVLFFDLDGDGVQDPVDYGMNGITCRLESQQGTILAETTSSASSEGDGICRFDGLETGTYVVRQIVPDGFRQATPGSAGDGGGGGGGGGGAGGPGPGFGVPPGGPGAPGFPPVGIGNTPLFFDFGDALENQDPSRPQIPHGYPVLLASDGARHTGMVSTHLGERVDVEGDGSPGFKALGDDSSPDQQLDDEDGVVFLSPFSHLEVPFDPAPSPTTRVPVLMRSMTGRVVFAPSATGRLDGWIDWNRDGDWSDPGEQVYDSVELETPTDTLSLSIPGDAAGGFSFARFRFSGTGDLEPTGPAFGGEVEDYLVLVVAPTVVGSTGDTPDANPGDGVCADATGRCTLRAAIQEANAGGGVLALDLSTAGKTGAATIRPSSALPPVTIPLSVHGASVIVDGSGAGAASGLELQTDGASVHALTVRGFSQHGIVIDGSGNRIVDSRMEDNAGDGVRVLSGRANAVIGTTFARNGRLGLNLVAAGDPESGVTADDPGDADAGPNDLLNAPVLTLVTAENGRVSGTVEGACTGCTVQVFSTASCDPSGRGEGETLLATVGVESGAFAVSLPAALDLGTPITALLTDGDGNTSEFSSCFVAVTTTIDEIGAVELPTGFELYQNYPNPFNPTTRIEFAVPEAAAVRLTLHDVLGRTVAVLVDETMSPGRHAVTFEAGTLPTGLYVYRLETPRGELSRTLVLMK